MSENNRDKLLSLQKKIIDRISIVLGNMAQWDSFAEVIRQLDAVIKMQDDLRQKTEQLREQEIESIFE